MSLALQSVKFPTQTAMKISVLVHSREFYKCLTCSPIEPFWNSSHDLDGGHGVHREHTGRHMETKPAFQTLARATFTVVTAKSACKGGADGHQRHSSPVTPHLIPEDENSTLWTARVTTLQTGKDLKTEKNDRDHTTPLMNTETRLKWRCLGHREFLCSRDGFIQACMQVANTKVCSHERPFSAAHFSKAQPGSLENTSLEGAGVGSTAPSWEVIWGWCRWEVMWLGPKSTAARMKWRVMCLWKSMCLTVGLVLACGDLVLSVVIPELERLCQEDFKFETTLGSTAKTLFQKASKTFYFCVYGWRSTRELRRCQSVAEFGWHHAVTLFVILPPAENWAAVLGISGQGVGKWSWDLQQQPQTVHNEGGPLLCHKSLRSASSHFFLNSLQTVSFVLKLLNPFSTADKHLLVITYALPP